MLCTSVQYGYFLVVPHVRGKIFNVSSLSIIVAKAFHTLNLYQRSAFLWHIYQHFLCEQKKRVFLTVSCILKRKILKKQKSIQFSQIRRISIVEMAIPTKTIYRFSETYFPKYWCNSSQKQKNFLNLVFKYKRPCIAKVILSKKNSGGGITTPHLKTCYTATVHKFTHR